MDPTKSNLMMNNSADLISLGILTCYLALLILAVWLGLGYLPIIALIVMLRWISIVQHNQIHSPIFRHRVLNRVINTLLFIVTGQQQGVYTYHHVETHHRFICGPQDWTCPNAMRLNGQVSYIVGFNVAVWRRSVEQLVGRGGSSLRQAVFDFALIFAVSAVVVNFCGVSPYVLALYVGVPWSFIAITLPLANRRQHRNCQPLNKYACANVSLGRFSTTWGFNTGYHNTHHAYPRLHWTQLKKRFEEQFAERTPMSNVLSSRSS